MTQRFEFGILYFMDKKIENSWFTISGELGKIDFKGDSYFRFPEEIVELVLNTYSKEGDYVLDPFAGFGTTLQVAQRMNRKAVGFEIDSDRATFANKGLQKPNKVINASIESIDSEDLPQFDLLFTSPPYITVKLEDDPWGESYFSDMKSIFWKIKEILKPNATIVVEVSNIRTMDGFRPLAWQMGELLSDIFTLQGEVIRCNTSKVEAGPGFDHSYLLVFKNDNSSN